MIKSLEHKRTRDAQDAAEVADFDARGFLACVVSAAAARAAFWRLMRSFFFAWPLRRLIFSELRRSMLPIAYDSSGVWGEERRTRRDAPNAQSGKNLRQSAQDPSSPQGFLTNVRGMFAGRWHEFSFR